MLLSIQDLSKSYDGGASFALKGVSLSVEAGEVVAVIGSSGAGKSTLLRCVNNLITPTGGSITFDEEPICCLKGSALRKVRRRISMVFQHYNLVGRATALENVLQGRLGFKNALAGALGIFSNKDKLQAYEALSTVGLSDCAYMAASQLSGGQKQRVGIARALVQDPLLILADEPIASLDPKSSRTVMELLRSAADQRNIACLVSLHQVEYALEFADRIVGISHGEVVFQGTPKELSSAAVERIYEDEPFLD